jgi:hypothetical protein
LDELSSVTVLEESISIAGAGIAVLDPELLDNSSVPKSDPDELKSISAADVPPVPAVDVFSGVVTFVVITSVAAIAGPESKATVAAVSKSARLYTSYLISNSSAGDGGPGFFPVARAQRRGFAPNKRPRLTAP